MISIISRTNRVPSVSLQIAQLYQDKLFQKGTKSHIVDLSNLPKDFAFNSLYKFNGKDEKFNEIAKPLKDSNHIHFVVPEYNGSFPGVLKTFIDGLSYPNPLKNKWTSLTGLGSGAMGGALALSHLNDILNYVGAFVSPIRVRIPSVEKNFSIAEGVKVHLLNELIDSQIDFMIKNSI